MEKFINFLNTKTATFLKDILKVNISDILLIIFYAILVVTFFKFTKYIKKLIKYYLYKNRAHTFYRHLYYRVDKIIKPTIYLIVLYFVTKIIEHISIIKINSDTDIVLFIVRLFLILWLMYEIIKFLLYATLKKRLNSKRSARRELFNLFLNISKIVFTLIATVAILSKFGVNITALITSLGIGGVIIGFSAKDTLVNFFDSIRIISEDAFRQGDWIETKDVEGFVTELGLTSTQIRTFDNAMVTIPNTKLANDYIKNWSKRVIGRRIKFHIPIKYTNDTKEIDKVIYEIYEMLHSHPDIMNLNKLKYLKKMKTTYEDGLFNIEDKYGVRKTLLVYLDEFGKYSMNILVYAFSISVNWEEWLRVKQDVLKKIINIINESELEFAYPTQQILLENIDKK